MKGKYVMLTLMVALMSLTVQSQEPIKEGSKDYVWSYQGNKKEHTFGVYGSVSGSYSEVLDKPTVWFGAKVGMVIDKKWGIGLSANVLDYDRTLNVVVSDGTYHLESAYTAMFVEHIIPIKKWGKIHLSCLSGMGQALYRYDKDFRENRPWYEEIIDTEKFTVDELGAEFNVRVKKNWWLGSQINYRFTSKINLMGTENDFLNKTSYGLTVKYGIY